MAEHKEVTGRGSLFKKHSSRVKEKVLQSLGKSDKTKDELFDDYAVNFETQWATCQRLNKELMKYISSAKGMSVASETLTDTLCEIHEEEWHGKMDIVTAFTNMDLLWADYLNKLQDQVLGPVTTYIAQFHEMKKKMEKRGRKLVDYDGARHIYNAAAKDKKRDENKIAKAESGYQEAKNTYEHMNNELLEDLPKLFDSRVNFYASNVQQLSNAESTFLTESGKIFGEISGHLDELMKQAATDPQYQVSRSVSRGSLETLEESADNEISRSPSVSSKESSGAHSETTEQKQQSKRQSMDRPPLPVPPVVRLPVRPAVPPTTPTVPPTTPTTSPTTPTTPTPTPTPDPPVTTCVTPVTPVAPGDDCDDDYATVADVPEPVGGDDDKDGDVYAVVNKPPKSPTPPKPEEKDESPPPLPPQQFQQIVQGAKEVVPAIAGELFQVVAIHRYELVDDDELEFDKGEIIHVIPFENEDDQDDGWLMGVKHSDGAKGVFPENFTKRQI